MASSRWVFSDAITSTTYSFEVNASQDSPVYQKNVQIQELLVPGGQPLLYEGQDDPSVFNVQGTLLTENQYKQLLFFYNLRHPFLLTDDLGRQRYVYLTEFQPVRTVVTGYPWKHSYTLSGYIISEVFP